MPLVPNSTTFSESHFNQALITSHQLNQIIIKCYGGTFGYREMLLEISDETSVSYNDINIYAYSVTQELVEAAKLVEKRHIGRFRFTTVDAPIQHKELLEEFSQSRIYIGASKSDGVSTSFLEALATGAYPIQTSTSCAGEWVASGARAGIVQPTKVAIKAKLEEVINDFETLSEAQESNLALARERLSYLAISKITCDFYK